MLSKNHLNILTYKHLNMNDFSEQLKNKMDEYVHLVYKITKNFPKDYDKAIKLAEEIGAMLWRSIQPLKTN